MKLSKILAAVFLSTFAVSSFSQGSIAKSKKSLFNNKKFEENTDITDAELRAQSGSRSRYSVKVSASYSGGKIADPLSKEQPVRNATVHRNLTFMSGSISARYRLDKRSAISFGSGVRALTPFHELKEVQWNSPYISWGTYKRHNKLQYFNSVRFSLTTQPEYKGIGQWGTFALSQGGKYQIGESNLYVGGNYTLSYFAYSRGRRDSDSKYASSYFLGVYPSLTYKVNRLFDINSSLAYNFANRRIFNDAFKLDQYRLTGRTGLGIAVSKTVYIRPYIDYLVEDFEWDTTSFSLSTTFSL